MAPRARPPSSRPERRAGPRSPVLLLGAGTGEATCGLLYLGGYLRRHGIEAFVRLEDSDESEEELERSLEELLAHVRPRVVGISLKWFHHLARGLFIARTVRRLDPSVRIVTGGDSASYYWQELAREGAFDHVILGDGELPLLSLCRGDAVVPNSVDGAFTRPPHGYVQTARTEDVFYSHFDELFLSERDRRSFSGWVAPGKGCGENCLYCGGTRGVQRAAFGRAKAFVRPAQSVRADHDAIVQETWQLRYDFAGGSAEYLSAVWGGFDLSRHATTYFLWGVPAPGLLETLAGTFGRVYLVLDTGSFSQTQRTELMKQGLLKPCPSDRQLMEVVEACRRHPNLKLEVCGIEGLPLATERTLAEEEGLVRRLLEAGCDVGSQRLEAQPGALVTQHPERFAMKSEARSYAEFKAWFEARPDGSVPMLRFLDPKLEARVQRTADRLVELAQAHAASQAPRIAGSTPLVANLGSTHELSLGEWCGAFRVPVAARKTPVTLVRSVDGAGLACAPDLSPRAFLEPSIRHGDEARAILTALETFARPTSSDAAIARLRTSARLAPPEARELVDGLLEAGFLRPG